MSLNIDDMLLSHDEATDSGCRGGSETCDDDVCWEQLKAQRDKTLTTVLAWLASLSVAERLETLGDQAPYADDINVHDAFHRVAKELRGGLS